MLTLVDNTPAQGYTAVSAVPVGTTLKALDGKIYLRTSDALVCVSNLNLSYPPDSTIVQGMWAVNATFTVTAYV